MYFYVNAKIFSHQNIIIATGCVLKNTKIVHTTLVLVEQSADDFHSFPGRKLINLLESFKQTGLTSEKKQTGNKKEDQKQDSGESNTTGGNGIVYELYYAPEHARLNQLASVAELEKKIDRIETLIGNNPDKLVGSIDFLFIITCILYVYRHVVSA